MIQLSFSKFLDLRANSLLSPPALHQQVRRSPDRDSEHLLVLPLLHAGDPEEAPQESRAAPMPGCVLLDMTVGFSAESES